MRACYRMDMLVRALCFSACVTLACATSATPPAAAPGSVEPEARVEAAVTPADALRSAESRLLSDPSVRVTSRIIASGAVAARVDVAVAMMAGNRLRFVATGEFAGQPVRLCYVSDGQTVRNGDKLGEATPLELNRAAAIGWVRMGLLHNVAMLSAGKGPDRADGGVAEWVRAVSPAWAPPRVSPAANERVIEFDLEVDSQPAGRVTLTTDATSGLPSSRSQVVQFPEGEMRVSEDYRYVRDAPPSAADFDVAAGCGERAAQPG